MRDGKIVPRPIICARNQAQIVSGAPTGKFVGPYANVVVNFDDYVYRSKQFVNIHRKGTTTPLAV